MTWLAASGRACFCLRLRSICVASQVWSHMCHKNGLKRLTSCPSSFVLQELQLLLAQIWFFCFSGRRCATETPKSRVGRSGCSGYSGCSGCDELMSWCQSSCRQALMASDQVKDPFQFWKQHLSVCQRFYSCWAGGILEARPKILWGGRRNVEPGSQSESSCGCGSQQDAQKTLMVKEKSWTRTCGSQGFSFWPSPN